MLRSKVSVWLNANVEKRRDVVHHVEHVDGVQHSWSFSLERFPLVVLGVFLSVSTETDVQAPGTFDDVGHQVQESREDVCSRAEYGRK